MDNYILPANNFWLHQYNHPEILILYTYSLIMISHESDYFKPSTVSLKPIRNQNDLHTNSLIIYNQSGMYLNVLHLLVQYKHLEIRLMYCT